MRIRIIKLLALSLVLSLVFSFGSVYAAPKSSSHDLTSDIFEDRRSIPNGGDFTLESSNGPVSLTQFKEKVVILLFGYLSCPDICPTQLKKVATALKNVDVQDRKDVQVLFITLDPERDTLENLDKFVAYFDKNIIALTGDIKPVTELYGVKYSKVKTKDGKGYFINHTVASYILSPDNVIRYILPHDVTSHDIVHVIHNLFKKFYPVNL